MDSSVVLHIRNPGNVSEEQQPLLANSDRNDGAARPVLAGNTVVVLDQTAEREMRLATQATRASLINAKSDLNPCYRAVNTTFGLFFGSLAIATFHASLELREPIVNNGLGCWRDNHVVSINYRVAPRFMWNSCIDVAILSVLLVITGIAVVLFTKLAISQLVKACRSPAKLVILREYDKNVLSLHNQKATALFKKNPEVQAAYKSAEKAHEQLWNEAVKALKKNDNQANVKVIADFSIKASRANAEYAAIVNAAASKEG